MYYIFDNPALKIQSGKVTGNWQRTAFINSPAPVEKDVFGLWIDHGTGTGNSSYCYIIFPDVNEAERADIVDKADIKIIQRDKKVHAVQDKNIFQAVFFEPASVSLEQNEKISVLTPCLVMMETDEKNRIISICDPTWKESRVKLKLTGKWSGKHCTYDETEKQTILTVPTTNTKGATICCRLIRQ